VLRLGLAGPVHALEAPPGEDQGERLVVGVDEHAQPATPVVAGDGEPLLGHGEHRVLEAGLAQRGIDLQVGLPGTFRADRRDQRPGVRLPQEHVVLWRQVLEIGVGEPPPVVEPDHVPAQLAAAVEDHDSAQDTERQ
jgi:hypothetical protein